MVGVRAATLYPVDDRYAGQVAASVRGLVA